MSLGIPNVSQIQNALIRRALQYLDTRLPEGLPLVEVQDLPAPDTNNAVVYARDNGAGKTQLVVRFPTGAIQVISTEP